MAGDGPGVSRRSTGVLRSGVGEGFDPGSRGGPCVEVLIQSSWVLLPPQGPWGMTRRVRGVTSILAGGGHCVCGTCCLAAYVPRFAHGPCRVQMRGTLLVQRLVMPMGARLVNSGHIAGDRCVSACVDVQRQRRTARRAPGRPASRRSANGCRTPAAWPSIITPNMMIGARVPTMIASTPHIRPRPLTAATMPVTQPAKPRVEPMFSMHRPAPAPAP